MRSCPAAVVLLLVCFAHPAQSAGARSGTLVVCDPVPWGLTLQADLARKISKGVVAVLTHSPGRRVLRPEYPGSSANEALPFADQACGAAVQAGRGHLILLQRGGGISGFAGLLRTVRATDGVLAASPFALDEFVAHSQHGQEGVVVEGVLPDTYGYVVAQRDALLPEGTLPRVLAGRELLAKLRLGIGDRLMLSGLPLAGQDVTTDIKATHVAGAFRTGLAEFDQRLVITSLADAQFMIGMGDEVTGLIVMLEDPARVRDVGDRLVAAVGGEPFFAVPWLELNKAYFEAMALSAKAAGHLDARVLIPQLFKTATGCRLLVSILDLDPLRVDSAVLREVTCPRTAP